MGNPSFWTIESVEAPCCSSGIAARITDCLSVCANSLMGASVDLIFFCVKRDHFGRVFAFTRGRVFWLADCCGVGALGICAAQSGPNLLIGSAETVQRAVCSRRFAVRGLAGSLSRGSRWFAV